jgi:Tfp pilus assembly protein PilX
MGKIMMIKNNNRGYVLVTSLLMLLVLTVIGMAAIGTSTIENLLSGNIRLKERNEVRADGCTELSLMVIERAVRNEDVRGFTNIVTDASLADELRSGSFNSDTLSVAQADITCNTGAGTTSVADIDMMYPRWIGGTSLEFASGYEGLGKSGGSGFCTFYRINSSGSGLINSNTSIGAVYRYVP